MSSLNKVELIGRLGKDPELRYTKDRVAIARFSFATSEFKKENGEKKEITQWHEIVVLRRAAEIADKYLKKGSRAFLEGKLEYHIDPKTKKRTAEVVVEKIILL